MRRSLGMVMNKSQPLFDDQMTLVTVVDGHCMPIFSCCRPHVSRFHKCTTDISAEGLSFQRVIHDGRTA